jgi:hypothetical protein
MSAQAKIKQASAALLCLTILSGCWWQSTAQAPAPQQEQKFKIVPPPVARVGRYQIVFSPHMREDTFLIDTDTGRIWQMTEIADLPGKPSVWEEMTRFNSPRDEILFRAAMGDKSPDEQQALDRLLKAR